jgi:hypothetical protein
MAPLLEAIFMGKVASGALRRKTTVLASGVSIVLIVESREAGP